MCLDEVEGGSPKRGQSISISLEEEFLEMIQGREERISQCEDVASKFLEVCTHSLFDSIDIHP